MAKRLILVGTLFLLAVGAVWAGDVAQFVNLGFSGDSRYFMFAQYGVIEKTDAPYAELFVVDVPANDFTPHGVLKVSYTSAVEPGDRGDGALFNLMEDAVGVKRQYRIDHLITGRLLYLLVDGGEPNDTLEFRDFQTGNSYSMKLLQSVTGTGREISSSYHIDLDVKDKSGKIKNLTVGNPSIRRTGVQGYHITQVVLAPDGKSLVFVIQRAELDTKGSNVRYMIETIALH
jgi:predicted secreted protein